ncbi:hypothetical protein TWF506_005801 [Arthrobotrys conoides]|uniref:Uncharacterized protein n=1 Tax=Arthrobotrys conoides TaxID=74498 RepID=A0AAN8NJX6_9PEZI
MRQPRILLLTTCFLFPPTHAFYRLWGYTDLRRNLENERLFKAQSSLLTRGGKQNQIPLCHSFPEPSDTLLGVIRVVGIMNHPDLANPIQALGLWEEKDFNCAPFLPRLVVYFQPGQETQIIDLRPFGGEWVYSNWRQIVPGDQYWNAFVAPEIARGDKPGTGFVKKLTRVEGNHNFAERIDTVWNTQVPENSWIIDKRPAILQRDASKSGFESRFKTELGTLLQQEQVEPLSDEKALELAVELSVMKQALREQYGKWQLSKLERQMEGRPQKEVNHDQFKKTIKTGTPVYLDPFMIWGQGQVEQQEQIGQQGRVEQQEQIGDEVAESPIEVKQEVGININRQGIKKEEVKEEEEEPADTNTISSNLQTFINPNDLRYQDPTLAMQAYINNLRTAQLHQPNPLAPLIQNYNPLANIRIPEPIAYANQNLNSQWTSSFEEMITMKQQELIQKELLRERENLEQYISNSGFLPIRPRLTPNQQVGYIPILEPELESESYRLSAPVTRLDEYKGMKNNPLINSNRILPPASEILQRIEAQQLRKQLAPNDNLQQPTWSQFQDRREETKEQEQRPNPNQLQGVQAYIRDFLDRNTKVDKRKPKDT